MGYQKWQMIWLLAALCLPSHTDISKELAHSQGVSVVLDPCSLASVGLVLLWSLLWNLCCKLGLVQLLEVHPLSLLSTWPYGRGSIFLKG